MVPQASLNLHSRRLRCGGFRSSSRVIITVLCLLLCVSANSSLRPADVSRPSPTLELENHQHAFRERWRPNVESPPTFQQLLGQDEHLPEQDGEYSHPQRPAPPPPRASVEEEVREDTIEPLNSFSALISALDVMQKWFAVWEGVWTESIDWTAAVLGTYVASALSTISASLDYMPPPADEGEAELWENIINRFFSQLTTFYFGQNSVALRMEAYDDMLWVVLGWLESIKFINFHASLHHAAASSAESFLGSDYNSTAWYGSQFIPAYAHRARVFYDLASRGWDTSLCGGGMIWNPRLLPYKNAITNELYITASIGMYLYFPGDDNSSPFVPLQSNENTDSDIPLPPPTTNTSLTEPYDPKYLTAALEAYKWLSTSNMTNDRGLYVDGFHISNFGNGNDTNVNTKCDDRNEMVYTYNQGVLLSGLRGLWESTGAQSYLDEGYQLIESVINATGWTWGVSVNDGDTGNWSGLGRNGVLEEACDYWGSCSQDGQTFKGIFFHHLTLYCAPLPSVPLRVGVTFVANARLAQLHDDHCDSYRDWIVHNARAAYATKNSDGKFGMWWGVPAGSDTPGPNAEPELSSGSIDYRNLGLPVDSTWGGRVASQGRNIKAYNIDHDLNDRGRGRTVETQGGGVSVLRAMWEIVDLRTKHRRR
ncbi:MAG: hypothetical protein M1813_005358 [Trichoglossum hirsutum]|nr:MAG: hypothetical protein M1813_005358 [Trichoglossum hirsutum]